jgi:hypothetical protein
MGKAEALLELVAHSDPATHRTIREDLYDEADLNRRSRTH